LQTVLYVASLAADCLQVSRVGLFVDGSENASRSCGGRSTSHEGGSEDGLEVHSQIRKGGFVAGDSRGRCCEAGGDGVNEQKKERENVC